MALLNDIVKIIRTPYECKYIYASDFIYNKSIVMEAVAKHPTDLCNVSKELRNDIEIVYLAVSKDGNTFRYASKYLRNDKDLALLAISNSYYDQFDENSFGKHLTFYYLSETLKNDMDIIIAAVKNEGFVLYYLSNELIMSNLKLVVYAINTSGIKVLSCVPYDGCTVEKDYYFVDEFGNHHLIGGLSNYNLNDHTYDYVYIHIKESIQTYENFLLFLHGVSAPRSESITRKLKTHGPYHSINNLRLIGKFAGVIHSNDYIIYKSVFSKVGFYFKV